MKICILLSTYNGEKYLKEQLVSLMAQKGMKCDILVRDDGSSDATCAILDRWQEKGLLKWYKGENLGFAMSFMDLVKNVGEYDYYAFCDQDDIWLPYKIREAVDKLEEIEGDIKLYCSNVDYYKDGKVLGQIHDKTPVFDKYTCMVKNIAPGCTMLFSLGLKRILAANMPKKIIAHDLWIYQVAMFFGTVFYDATPTILYRQHDNNQIGHKTKKCEIWSRRIRNLSDADKQHERENQAKEFFSSFGSLLLQSDREIVLRVANYRESFRNKMRLMFDGRYTMGRLSNNIYLWLRILFGKL